MQVAAAERVIAIVDDERPVREALARLLRADRYPVESYASGLEFLQSLEHARPACVLVDLSMPGISGYEVLRQLTKLPRPIPAIVVTADSAPHVSARAKSLGARAVLFKPIDDASLFEALDSALQG